MLTDPAQSSALLARTVHDGLSSDAELLAAHVAEAFGSAALAVIHYGSRAQGRRTRRESAFDFFVVVSSYGEAYRTLASTVGLHRAPWLVSGLARILPPNVLSLKGPPQSGGHTAKIAVFSERDFRRATSPRARDHFALGRLMQHVVLAWSRDADTEQRIVQAIANARRQTFDWGRPFLPAEFDAEDFCRVLLHQSFSGEIRPEHADHANELLAAQRPTLIPIYEELLEDLHGHGRLGRVGRAYRLPAEPGRLERARARYYFRRSKARNTLRLFKYVALYDGWLDYILGKVARSSGLEIEMTERERRWPLVFGWPKFIRYLRSRPQRGD